jgi:hypothetical protein
VQPKELPLTAPPGFRGLIDLLGVKQSASLALEKGKGDGQNGNLPQ